MNLTSSEWLVDAAELPMLDVYLPMMKASAIVSAGRLGLFEVLSEQAYDLATLSSRVGASEIGLLRLLEFLVSINYLEKQGDCFANTANTTRWFSSRGEADYTAGLLWTGEAWNMMDGLTDAVIKGGPETTLWDLMLSRPHWGPVFSSYMHAFARHLSVDLLQHVVLPEGATRLLDLGGSHGLHSIAFCQRYSILNAVIVDMESALTNTPNLIAAHHLSDRITLKPGNLLAQDWGEGYDIAFYLSVAHNQSTTDNLRVLQHLRQVLKPGAILVIHEYQIEPEPRPFHAAFQLTLLLETGTQIYSRAIMASWLAEAGFETPSYIDLKPLDKGSLIIARVPM